MKNTIRISSIDSGQRNAPSANSVAVSACSATVSNAGGSGAAAPISSGGVCSSPKRSLSQSIIASSTRIAISIGHRKTHSNASTNPPHRATRPLTPVLPYRPVRRPPNAPTARIVKTDIPMTVGHEAFPASSDGGRREAAIPISETPKNGIRSGVIPIPNPTDSSVMSAIAITVVPILKSRLSWLGTSTLAISFCVRYQTAVEASSPIIRSATPSES